MLSCLNSGLYTASRMAFSLGERGDAPKILRPDHVPGRADGRDPRVGGLRLRRGRSSTTCCPDTVFLFLLNSSGAVALFVWLVICFSQLRMRRIIQREAPGEAGREDVALPLPDLGDRRR